MPYIHYSGIGAHESEIHSITQFLNIMNHPDNHSVYYAMTSYGIDMEYNNYSLPADFKHFSLEEWLQYSGAKYYDCEW